jgi:hypothetical protein
MTQPAPRDREQPPAETPDLRSAKRDPAQVRSATVVFRFLLRMVVLGVFAAIGSLGYLETLASLLAMAALYCSIVAVFRREAPFGPALTHFDEAAAYALIACGVGYR